MSEKTFSFCESVHATGASKWHLRLLTDAGQKFGGGIDTPSLCGRVQVGWDINVPLSIHHLTQNCCPKCLILYDRPDDVKLEHTSSVTCWCKPELAHDGGKDGKVWVHRDVT